ncbi:mitochondrial inner-membrane-bound regulator-domain-containing protein [Daldinia decipiens]|uniref:mitochondrial inner-membrane-bound regulator-domain-containing protein n=1 Tax=Daldinia decipiens TaxID=326647 RepID=UPI0020C551FE|nr:mitochondrial inner-membrane-bound regulator-domain-containing protein [Daldinia decipiens]KAI1652596.1 mitochondrial inner-membrane-bound regulator-domain-containing protein [Daldinia decipiens]
MLATRVTSGAICLRCRLRLLHRSAQPFHASSRITRTQHPTLRRFYGDSTARSLDNDLAPEDEVVNPESKNEARDRKRERNARHASKILILHKKRLSRNRVLVEDSGSLSTGMLGKPASVIIMRDEGLRQRKYNPSTPDDSDDKPDNRPANLEALLKLQRETPTAEEVHDNVHNLKPKSDTTLLERDFRKLQAELMNGFLSGQLHDYLEHHKQGGRSPKFDLRDTASIAFKSYSWVRDISPWVPLNPHSDPVEGGNISLHGYTTESTTLKEELALRIMRECWGLSIAELDSGLGEINIKVRNSRFLLLMRGTRRWTFMDRILLDPGEKIEAFRARKTLRIVATKTKASTLVEGLAKVLKQIDEANYPSDLIASEPLDEAVLEEIGRITNTHTRFNQITRRLHVTWIESEGHASQGPVGLRSPGDEVFRLLLTAFNPQPATAATLLAADLESQATGRFVMDTASKEKLGWNDKAGAWARYILPVASEENDPAVMKRLDRLELPITPHPELPISNGLDMPSSDALLFPYDGVEWTKEFQVSTVAQFGSLLHANNPSTSPPSLPDLLTANHPRVFAAATPHAIQLTKFNNGTRSPAKTRTSVVIRFWPTPILEPIRNKSKKKKRKAKPSVPSVTTPPAPLLELRLAVSGNEINGIESFRAIKRTQVTDVMLPASLVDLRFTQAQYAVPEGELSELTSWEPLNSFLRSSRFNLEHGEFKTPSKQSFSVPWYPAMRRFSGDPTAFMASPESGTPRNLDTDYTLASLEVHRSISMPYEGFKLSYTSIEAGPESERRAEVTLEPENSAGPPKGGARTYHDSFLAACQKLASTDMLWSGLHNM